MKQSYNLSTLFFVIMGVIMLVTTGLLIAEYRYFKEQSRRVLILQDEYQLYIQMFKETYLNKKKNSLADGLLSGIEESETTRFNVVNRDSDYLRMAAQDFGKENNLTSILSEAYDYYDGYVKISREPSQNSLKRRRISSRSKKYSIVDHYSLVHNRSFRLSWPIDPSQFWLSSKFGPRKKKNDKAWGFHHGIDLAALKGTPVCAAADGVVIEAIVQEDLPRSKGSKGYGNYIVIQHNEHFKTRYAHLYKVKVNPKQRVKRGQVIGSVGNSGHVHSDDGDKNNAYHLHFECIERGKCINPLRNLRA